MMKSGGVNWDFRRCLRMPKIVVGGKNGVAKTT